MNVPIIVIAMSMLFDIIRLEYKITDLEQTVDVLEMILLEEIKARKCEEQKKTAARPGEGATGYTIIECRNKD